ncbi:hypothetical protein WJX77_011458 [Trebouxia sp. C0004]
MPTAKRSDEQAAKSLAASHLAPGSNSPTGGLAGTSDQGSERPPSRRTREQAAAGSRRLRSGATIAEPDEEDQLMSLDASGKPVVVARPASAKPGSSMPSKIKTSSSASQSVPGSKPKGSASGNRSTAGSQRPGSAKPLKGRLAPLSIPSGQDQADSPRSPSGPAHSPTCAVLPASTRSADASAQAEGTDKAEEDEQGPSTSSKPNMSPVLKSTRGPAPAKVGSPRSPRQPASPSERKTRAGAESRRALEEAAAAAETRLAEDAIIEHAQIIYERRNTKQLPAFPEPKRGKAHWDHVLEEMNWMAKEFSKERRWKIAQAKRFAKLVSKSNLDVEGRERLRRKEELLNLKKRAAWIAKEAMQFWRKAERVVQYKQQVVSNARKKEVMDKHLDFLVGQTQRYSTLLAQRLAGTEEQTGVEALPAPTDATAPAGAVAASDVAASKPAAAASATPATVAPAASENSDAEDEEGSPAHGNDSSVEYAADLNGSPDDDEATLEEEEALSKAEGGTKDELHSLEAEADMPLEQLLAQYGYVMGGGQGTIADDEDDGRGETAKATAPAGSTERAAKRRRTSSNGVAHASNPAEGLSKAQPAAAQESAAQNSGSQAPGELESESAQSSADLRDLLDSPEAAAAADSVRSTSHNSPQPGPSKQVDNNREKEKAALPKQEMDGLGSESQSESEFDSAAGSDAGVDDEQTLEEEERMAEAEGAAQHASELEDLEDEANMPLEQLMAKYGYTACTDVPTPSHPSSPPPVNAHSDPSPPPAATSTDPSPPSLPPHASPQRPAKPMSSRSKAQASADLLADAAPPTAATKGDAMQAMQTQQQAEQATAAGMDAFEHSQALAERRASGSQASPSSPSGPVPAARGRGRAVTSKAQVAGEVAEAAPLAASQLPSSNGTTSALPAASQLPSASQAEGRSASPRLLGTSGKAQLVDHLTGNIEGAVVPPVPLGKGSIRQKDAIERAAEGKAHLEGVAKLANQLQPTGSTLSTMQVHTKVPFLLKHGLREYQHIGLDWLMTIYTRRLNGILADEMGLGKTIMTIALLAHLACEKGDWGPHLIVVPTSVMLNWEMEFKKWCPAFKLLTYFGSAKERKTKRHGWSKPNAFHICITSYTLVLQDAKMFRRKKWKYLILDEAHMIKNWKSQRWQTLLNFNSKRRLLITGTPLQNDLMELWSLMHFLMPQIFASHAQFKDWFNNPLVGMVEGQQEVNKGIVERLHSVLRPFLLRRLKCDVEKQLPQKKEHVIRCRLSKRQRTLYEDYMASSDTSATLASSNFLGIINVLMQLRKVCNHPDLFEGRPIVSSFDMWGLPFHMPSLALHALSPSQWDSINLSSINADVTAQEADFVWAAQRRQSLMAPSELIEGQAGDPTQYVPETDETLLDSLGFPPSRQAMAVVQGFVQAQAAQQQQWALSRLRHAAVLTARRCAAAPLYGQDVREAVTVEEPVAEVHLIAAQPSRYMDFSNSIAAAIKTAAQRAESLEDTMKQFLFVIPQARSPPPTAWCSHPDQSVVLEAARQAQHAQQEWFQSSASLRTAVVRRQLFFPDRRLLQFDCGKLQELAQLLYQLKTGGHKALIFTQMTKMLDVLEAFLNLHGYTYLRLDGTTKPEQRQILMQRFNSNPKIFVFILSTRSGGVGMNLTGADTVIFYDSDWNPAMDAQAQDRCHRIGQTREVHIYRLVSEKTIEENILTKSDQKRQLDHLAIQSGGFNTEFLQKFNPKELLGVQPGGAASAAAATATAATSGGGLSAEEMQAAMRSVEDETDAAAAAALEQENAAELAEFTVEPAARAAGEVAGAEAGDDAEEEEVDVDDIKEPSDSRPREASMPINASAAADPDRQAPPSEPGPSTAIVPLAGADEDEMMEDVAQMAGGGQVSAQDALTNLETTLRPVEKYAVRFLEEMQRQTAAESAAAEAEQLEMQEQEWNMAELERIQEQQEADMDEEGDAERAAQWDLAAADAAYKAQVEAALAHQRAVEEEQRLLLEQLEEQAAAAAAARAEEEERLAVRPQRKAAPRPVRSRAASPSSDSEEFDSPVARYRDSRWAGKRELDGDRPLGRGMRFKQEPAHIHDSSFASGSDPLSPAASKRRRTHFTSTGPSRFTRTAPSSDPRQPPSDEAVQEGADARTAARPARRLPRHIFSHGPAALTARGAPVQIWQPWEAVEDLVLCAMVRSALTAALGLPLDAVPGSHPTAPRPSPPTFNSNPLQPSGAPSQQPQPMATAQAARPASYMTTATAQSFGAGGVVNHAPRAAGQQASGVSSLTALIGQPLPPASHPPAHPTSTAASSPASGAAALVSAQSTSAPAVGTAPTAAVATMAAFSSGTGQAATGNVSIGTSQPVPAAPQASIPHMPPIALAVATAGPQITSAPATAAHHPATVTATALTQLPNGTAGMQMPCVAAPQLPSASTRLAGQPPQVGFVPLPPTVSAAPRLIPGSSNVLLAPTLLAASSTPASVSPQQLVSGAAAAPQAARPFTPAARAGSAGVGLGQGVKGSRTAAVGEDVWQLASDVMAAGGTATTAAAVTTAAQQAKKRSASDCRARFLMLVRARQAALAPQIFHRPHPNPPPAAARPAPAAAIVPYHPSAAAAPQPTAVLAHMQHQPTASLQIASALAGQPSNPMLQPASISVAVQPAVAATAAWQPAAVLPVVATAAAAPAPVAPQLTSAQAGAQTQGMQSSQPAGFTATIGPSGSQTPSVNLPSPGNVSRTSAPINTVSSVPMAASAAASSRPMGPLASSLPGQFAAAVAAAAAAAADTTAVPGRGRSVQLVHKASLDVLRLKLRLVDLVQGSAALQPKELRHAFGQATAAAAAETQAAAASKPPSSSQSPSITPAVTPAPAGPTQPPVIQPSQSQLPPQLQSQSQSQSPLLSCQSGNILTTSASSGAAATASTAPAAAAVVPVARAFPGSPSQNPQRPGIFSTHASSSGVSGSFAIPSVVSGAEKAVKDLEQLAAADPETLIDSIEELLPRGTSQDAGVAAGFSAGLITGVTDPVLSKGNGSLTQEKGGSDAVEVGLQEAVDILTAATKGCGSYAKPILRHITTVAEFAQRDGVQAANEALLKLLQVPKAVPQHAISQQHQQHVISQQQQQHQQPRPLQAASAQPATSITSHGMPTQYQQPTSTAGTSQQLPFGAFQLQQQRPQLQQQQRQQLLQQLHQQPHQQPPQATQLWQQPQTGSASAAPSLPTSVSFLQAPTSSLGPQAALASLAPLAVQISAANLAGISQPSLAALGNQLMDQSRTGGTLAQQMPVMALPASLVLSGVPVGTSQPAVSSTPAVCEGHRNV